MKHKIVLVIILLFSVACRSETNIGTQYALNALEDNMLTTDYTALINTAKISVSEVSKNAATEASGLMAVKYSAMVTETYHGSEHENITYIRYVEKGEEPEATGSAIRIVSLCQDKNGNYYLPDIGYELPADNEIKIEARRLKVQMGQKTSREHENTEHSACN